jgi:hypothetical protein
MSEPPTEAGVAGQATVNAICGVVKIGQVTLAVSVTGMPQVLLAFATKVSDVEQFVGAR